MLRIVLSAIVFLLTLQFVSAIARLIRDRKPPDQRPQAKPQSGDDGARARRRHEDAVDVPFTDIPPDSSP